MKLLPKKPTNQASSTQAGSHDGIGRGMECAVLVLMFFGIGYGLDSWLDTKPIFMIVFVILAIIGQFASLYYNYDERMKELEARRTETAQRGRTKLR